MALLTTRFTGPVVYWVPEAKYP